MCKPAISHFWTLIIANSLGATSIILKVQTDLESQSGLLKVLIGKESRYVILKVPTD